MSRVGCRCGFGFSAEEPVPGDDSLAGEGVEEHVDETGAAEDCGRGVDDGEIPGIACKLGQPGNR